MLRHSPWTSTLCRGAPSCGMLKRDSSSEDESSASVVVEERVKLEVSVRRAEETEA